MADRPATVDAYLAALPADRRALVEAVRAVIRAHMDPALEEGLQYGMIGYYVPHSRYPAGYHCDPKQPLPYAGLASTKSHVALHLMAVYGDDAARAWFTDAWTATGHRLDMGAACVRFKRLADIPLEVIGEAFSRLSVAAYLDRYEATLAARPSARRPRPAAATAPAGTPATKKSAAKKPAAKKPPAKKPAAKKPAS